MTIGQDHSMIGCHLKLGLLGLEQNRGPYSVPLWLSSDLEDGGIVGRKDLGAFGPQQKGLGREEASYTTLHLSKMNKAF